MTPTIQTPEQDHPGGVQTDRELYTWELIHRALRSRSSSWRGGSRSPVLEECTLRFITVLANELVALSDRHGRPETKIVGTAHKALTALEFALHEIDDESRNPNS